MPGRRLADGLEGRQGRGHREQRPYKGPFASALEAGFRDLRAVGQPFRVTVFEGNRVVDVAEE